MVRVGLALLVCGCVLGMVPGALGASLWDGTTAATTGWAVVPSGFVSVRDDAFTPGSAGAYRMLLSTGTSDEDNLWPDGQAACARAVAGFVDATTVDVGGHPGFDAGGAVEGTAVKASFTAFSGDELTITFDFLTIEPSAEYGAHPLELGPGVTDNVDDFAFVAVSYVAENFATGSAERAGKKFSDGRINHINYLASDCRRDIIQRTGFMGSHPRTEFARTCRGARHRTTFRLFESHAPRSPAGVCSTT